MNQQMSSALVQGDNTPVVLVGEDGKRIESISSREVAEMLEVEHSKLLRKIDDINDSFRKAEIGFSKYWLEGTYRVEGNKKNYREFQVTKLGCEFLANKCTGDKGNIFTAKYIERFHNMEDYIKENKAKPTSAIEELRMHYKVLEEHDQEIQEVRAEVADLKDNMPLFNIECKEIQSLVKKKGTSVLGGYKSNAYNDNSLRGKVYSDIQKQLRREFGVEKYEAIKRSQFDIAKQIISEYKAPTVLIQEINALNAQTTLFDKKEE